MFNICDTSRNINEVCLYDERAAGKGANAVCSLGWNYYCSLLKTCQPEMIIKVLDNCSAQNKSSYTFMFDCLLSVLLYERVVNFYLIPGHSHMRADQVVSLCKKALDRKDLYLPEQIAGAMSTVKHMNASVYNEEFFHDWESFLPKHFKKMPPGFTKFYHFEFAKGSVIYKSLATSCDDEAEEFVLLPNIEASRKAILKDLLNLPSSASQKDIINAKLQLPKDTPPVMSDSKAKSIGAKLSCIPEDYRGYYPGYVEFATRKEVDEAPRAVKRPKKGPGRPKNVISAKQNASILKFVCSKSTPLKATENIGSKGTAPEVVTIDDDSDPPAKVVVMENVHPHISQVITITDENVPPTPVRGNTSDEQIVTTVHPTPRPAVMNADDSDDSDDDDQSQPLGMDTAQSLAFPRNFKVSFAEFKRRMVGVRQGTQCPWIQKDPGTDDTIQ